MPSHQWTTESVALRFEECVSVINKLPSGLSMDARGYWPTVILTPREIARQEKRKRNFIPPLPDAIDRAEETMQWIQFVEDPVHRKIIWLRTSRLPWRGIAREVGLSTRTIRRKYDEQLLVIVSHLQKRAAKVA